MAKNFYQDFVEKSKYSNRTITSDKPMMKQYIIFIKFVGILIKRNE